MNILNIALLQIKASNDLKENIKIGTDACIKAKEMKADIALFPEMFSNCYDIYKRDYNEWKNDAISLDSEYVNSFKELSKKLDMSICITLLEKTDEGVRNSLVLFDRFGERKIVYAKVHTCRFDVEKDLVAGEDFYVCDLDTRIGNIKVGAMICYDREFPESARILMIKGAEVILVPNACPMEINRLSQLRGRAYENMLAIATCNYPETVDDCNGGSNVFDGVAYFEGYSGSRDTCVFKADGKEGIYIASIDMDMLRKYREEEIHGNKYRRPDKYSLLIKDNNE